MIIYKSVFNSIISPFIGVADYDELNSEAWDVWAKNGSFALIDFIEKKIEGYIYRIIGDSYLKCINVKNTLYYYVYCYELDKLVYKLERDLIGFTDFRNFTAALENIYKKMAENTGPVKYQCNDFVENTEYSQDLFKEVEAWLAYMKT